MAPRGLRARHVVKGNKVNVGDPDSSSTEVSVNKCKSKEIEKTVRKSDGSQYSERGKATYTGKDPGYISTSKEKRRMGQPSHSATNTKLERIAWLSQQDSGKEFECLMHLLAIFIISTFATAVAALTPLDFPAIFWPTTSLGFAA